MTIKEILTSCLLGLVTVTALSLAGAPEWVGIVCAGLVGLAYGSVLEERAQ